MGGCSKATTHMTVIILIKMALPTKGHGDAGRHQPKERKRKGMNFAQFVYAVIKKALCKQTYNNKKSRSNNSDSNCNSNKSS